MFKNIEAESLGERYCSEMDQDKSGLIRKVLIKESRGDFQ
jgi:hypothetical protein